MADKYSNFRDLSGREKEGVDFMIEIDDRGSNYVVIAIHGGNIEFVTTKIAKAISAESHSFYSLVGLKKEQNRDLHITSTNFDEPKCINLINKCQTVISVHGKAGADKHLMVGGLNQDLIRMISSSLKAAGYKVLETSQKLSGILPQNVCNRCLSRKGIQLEISRGLRDSLAADNVELSRFCEAVRSAFML